MRKLLVFLLTVFMSATTFADNTNKHSENSFSVLQFKHDDTANDSDKSWTVPAGKTWELRWAHVILATTATVGNRQIFITVSDGTNEVMDLPAGAVQAASLTRHYAFVQGDYRETSFVGQEIYVPVADELILHPGWVLQFSDENGIDAAADDMTVSFQVLERDT